MFARSIRLILATLDSQPDQPAAQAIAGLIRKGWLPVLLILGATLWLSLFIMGRAAWHLIT